MPNRRELITSISVGSVALLSGCSAIPRDSNPLSNEPNLELFWSPTSDSNSYRFRLASLTGDSVFVQTENVDGEVSLDENTESNCSRESCIYEIQEVDESVELFFSEDSSGYIEFVVAQGDQTKAIARFTVSTESLKYLT